MSTAWATMPSPVGDLLLQTDGVHLTAISFEPCSPPTLTAEPAHPVLVRAKAQVEEYFAGRRRDFDIPLSASGTQFQQKVWATLGTIPYGLTASYGQIAQRLGLPAGASRAVGAANGANPIAIVVLCHRVIGSNGSLTGYAGGLQRKRLLLQLESRGLF